MSMQHGRKTTLTLVAFLVVLTLSAYAPPSSADMLDDDPDAKPWTESEVQLPPYPNPENMIPFTVGAVRDTTFMIDGESLSIGADGVIRYAIQVTSASGATNTSYEGMRCSSAERKFYAFGRPDHTWTKAKNSQWVKIKGSSNNHHVELYSNYFCRIGATAYRSVDEIRRALRSDGRR